MRSKEVWLDIDTATRSQMALAFAQERAKICKLLTQITLDMDHFNSLHPDEHPLTIVLDFNNDVAELRAVEDERAKVRLKMRGAKSEVGR